MLRLQNNKTRDTIPKSTLISALCWDFTNPAEGWRNRTEKASMAKKPRQFSVKLDFTLSEEEYTKVARLYRAASGDFSPTSFVRAAINEKLAGLEAERPVGRSKPTSAGPKKSPVTPARPNGEGGLRKPPDDGDSEAPSWPQGGGEVSNNSNFNSDFNPFPEI